MIRTNTYYMDLMNYLETPVKMDGKELGPIKSGIDKRFQCQRTSSLPSTIPSIPTTKGSPISQYDDRYCYEEPEESADTSMRQEMNSIPYSEKSSEDVSYYSGISIQDLAENLPIEIGQYKF